MNCELYIKTKFRRDFYEQSAFCKITALLTASLMTVMSMGVVSAQTDNNAQIKSIDAENGT